MFYNRDKEQKEILKALKGTSSFVNIVYGPINSGKTNLITHVLQNLSQEYIYFYNNLRRRDISDTGDFLNVLFNVDRKTKLQNVGQYVGELLKGGSEILELTTGIPIPSTLFNLLFKTRDKGEDAFKYLEDLFYSLVKKKLKPIFVLDELQIIKEIANSRGNLLIEKLFNLLVGITKETHLCHCFVVSSDSLFIQQIYGNARLEGRSEYIFVDDLDKERAFEMYDKFGFSSKEKIWNIIGGKIGDITLLNYKLTRDYNIKESLETMLSSQISRLKILDGKLFNKDEKDCENKMALLFQVADKGTIEYQPRSMTENLKFWVDQNMLFFDPVKNIIKPQSKLILNAIKKMRN